MLNKNSILCIDDDPVVLAILKSRLEKVDGYKVLTARDGACGIKMALKKKPDIILLDWMLPDQTGLSVLETLRGDSRTTWVPIFMLTGRTKMVDVERALERGAEGYFTKPINLNQICNRLSQKREAA